MINYAMRLLRRFIGEERGASAVEYGLIAALIAVIIIVGVALIGTNLGEMFNDLGDCVGDPENSTACP